MTITFSSSLYQIEALKVLIDSYGIHHEGEDEEFQEMRGIVQIGVLSRNEGDYQPLPSVILESNQMVLFTFFCIKHKSCPENRNHSIDLIFQIVFNQSITLNEK